MARPTPSKEPARTLPGGGGRVPYPPTRSSTARPRPRLEGHPAGRGGPPCTRRRASRPPGRRTDLPIPHRTRRRAEALARPGSTIVGADPDPRPANLGEVHLLPRPDVVEDHQAQPTGVKLRQQQAQRHLGLEHFHGALPDDLAWPVPDLQDVGVIVFRVLAQGQDAAWQVPSRIEPLWSAHSLNVPCRMSQQTTSRSSAST